MTKPKRAVGRPKYNPTANRPLVKVMAADGKTQGEIAEALSISIDTIQRYHAADFAAGTNLVRAKILAKQAAKAEKGDTAAARLFLNMISKGEEKRRAQAAEDEFLGEAAGKAPKLGKKEAAIERAREVTENGGSDWGDLTNPDAIDRPVQLN